MNIKVYTTGHRIPFEQGALISVLDGHTVEAGLEGCMSRIKLDGKIIKEQKREI